MIFGLNISQSKQSPDSYILGDWHCVKHDYRGYQKFSLKQAEAIKKIILKIKQNGFSYSKADFVEKCDFIGWQASKYDTSEQLGYSIEYRYQKTELAKLLKMTPVDKKGNLSCYNERSTFFLKGDILIKTCGGYRFYWLKVKKK